MTDVQKLRRLTGFLEDMGAFEYSKVVAEAVREIEAARQSNVGVAVGSKSPLEEARTAKAKAETEAMYAAARERATRCHHEDCRGRMCMNWHAPHACRVAGRDRQPHA